MDHSHFLFRIFWIVIDSGYRNVPSRLFVAHIISSDGALVSQS